LNTEEDSCKYLQIMCSRDQISTKY